MVRATHGRSVAASWAGPRVLQRPDLCHLRLPRARVGGGVRWTARAGWCRGTATLAGDTAYGSPALLLQLGHTPTTTRPRPTSSIGWPTTIAPPPPHHTPPRRGAEHTLRRGAAHTPRRGATRMLFHSWLVQPPPPTSLSPTIRQGRSRLARFGCDRAKGRCWTSPAPRCPHPQPAVRQGLSLSGPASLVTTWTADVAGSSIR